MLKSTRTRILAILAILAAIAVVAAGVLVPIAATAAVAYPAQAPGVVSIDQVAESTIGNVWISGFPAGTTYSPNRQWYRGSTAIAGATEDDYTMSTADHGKLLKVRVKVTVPGFAPTYRYSEPGNFTFTRSGDFSIAGSPAVGSTLVGVDDMIFKDPSGNAQIPDRNYQWLVNGVATAPLSALLEDFEVLDSHFGKKISLRVAVTNYGIAPQVHTTPAVTITLKRAMPTSTPAPTAQVLKETIATGLGFQLRAQNYDLFPEPGDTVKYQWYRQHYTTLAVTAITGKTAITYAPVAADYPYRIFVRTTWARPGYQPTVLESFHRDYSLRLQDAGIAGIPQVGVPSHAYFDYSYEDPNSEDQSARFYTPGGAAVTRQWYRAGVLIPDATSPNYTPIPTDVAKALTFRATGSFAGFIPGALTSPATPKVVAGSLDFSSVTPPSFVVSPTFKVTVTPGVGPSPSATISKYQWLRNGVTISGATSTSIQLTAADGGNDIEVRIFYSAPGYATEALWSQPVQAVQPSTPLPVIEGDPRVGGTLDVAARTYENTSGATISPDELIYQWKRNGVVVFTGTGATTSAYQIQQADEGKTITVTVTAREANMLPSISTSVGIIIGDLTLENWDAQPGVAVTTEGDSFTRILRAGTTGITGPNTPTPLITKYQWYRGALPISGATAVTYTLTATDRGANIWVRVTTSHAAVAGQTYSNSIKDSEPRNYTLTPGPVTIATPDGFQVGDEIYLPDPTFTTTDGAVTGVFRMFEWLRNGKLIAPASSNNSYVLQLADLGSKISVRVKWGKPGYLGLTATVATSPTTQVVAKNEFDLGTVHPGIDSNTIGTLKVQIPGGVTPVPDKYTYQWLRNGVGIAGKTAATYTLGATDAGKDITVRVTAVRAGYTSAALPVTSPWDPDIVASGPITLDPGPHKVGETIGMTLPSYSTDAFGVASVFATYRWLRNGVVIAGQTGNTYTLGNADLNASIQAQAVITLEGHLARTDTSAGTFPTAKGTTTMLPNAVVTVDPTAATLTASITGMEPATPTPALSYQWVRAGVPISKATKATYKPVAADATADLSVRITVNRGSAFDVPVLGPIESDPRTFRAHHGAGDQPLTISGTAQVGQTLTADFIPYVDEFGNPVAASILRTWYRNNVPISGAVNVATQTYTLTAADEGKTITVRETVTSSTTLPLTVMSVAKGPIAKGTLSGSFDFATVTKNAQGFLVPTITPGTINQPGPYVLSYRWMWNGVSGELRSTASTYKLTAADTGKDLRVFITVGKAGYTTVPNAVVGIGNWLQTTGEIFVNGADFPHEGSVFHATAPLFTAPGITSASQYTVEYSWFRDDLSTFLGDGDTYEATSADVGHNVFVRVVVRAPGYDEGIKASVMVPVT